MTPHRSLLLVPLALVLLAGCAAMDPNVVRRRSCHYDGAFEDGMNAARSGKEMSSGYLEVCDGAALADARRGYREGYLAGSGARIEEQRTAAIVAEEQRAAALLAPDRRAYLCEVSTSGDTFASFGPTETEASAAARSRCEGAHPGGMCWPVSCRQNR